MGTSLIANPPYNLKWNPPVLASFMRRYSGYTIPPKENANYAFILSGLSQVDDRAVFLFPNSVLNSSVKAEQELKIQLIEQNILLAIISLPPNMFESTNIPTCILVFDKHKDTRKIAMIDLSECCEEQIRDQRGQFGGKSHTERTYHKTLRVIPHDIMETVIERLESKQDVTNLCKWVMPEEIKANGYNLAPKRYFKSISKARYRSFADISNDYNRIVCQKNAIKIRMNKTVAKRLGYDCLSIEKPDIREPFAVVGQKPVKEDYISFGADDGIKIQISTKEGIHPLIIDFLSRWKQMIIYLNNEENRYLAEFRDALLPKLLSGEIEVKKMEADDDETD